MNNFAWLVVVLVGCGGGYGPAPQDEEKALEIVWTEFGMPRGLASPTRRPPPVRWMAPACWPPVTEFERGSVEHDHEGCLDGWYVPQPEQVAVTWAPGQKISDTSYAHQLRHAALFYEKLVTDPEHTWGHAWGVVGKANEALRAAGLALVVAVR